jgi:hypothetical protein
LVVLAREIGLATLTNGKLLAAAAESGFDALITIDKQMRHQQPISSLPIAVIVIDVHVSKLENLLPLVPEVLACLDKIENGQLRIVTNRS